MSNKRRLVRKYEPGGNPGFLGEGHIARALIQGDFRDTDPFILLMDDMLDKKTNEPWVDRIRTRVLKPLH